MYHTYQGDKGVKCIYHNQGDKNVKCTESVKVIKM